MPWNDHSKPGPWGSRPGGGGPDDKGGGDKGSSGDDAGKGSDRPGGDDGPRKGPWSQGPQSRGPRSSGPQGPRRPPSAPQGPDLEDLMRQLRDRFSRMFGGGAGARPGAFAAIFGVAFALWAVSGVYMVQPDQEAVVTRFGAYTRSEGSGLRYHLPSPIEKVEKVSVTNLNRLDVGGAAGAEAPEESLMLTGDENIVDLNFSVQWRVQDAAKFLFRLSDPDAIVKMVAESAVREVVGKNSLQAILTTGRGQVQAQTAELMQRILDSYGAGVSVVEVQIRTANPPAEVIAAFRSVANAGQDAEASINEANTYRNRVINEAKGDAARITRSAEGYRERVVREAEGEASRFAQIEAEYKKAPAVTRQRLYLETMERVLRNSNKVVIDGKGGTAPIVLPSDLLRPRQAAPPPAPPPPQPQAQAQPSAGAAQ